MYSSISVIPNFIVLHNTRLPNHEIRLTALTQVVIAFNDRDTIRT